MFSRVLPTSRVFTSGYVNMETILHFFIVTLNYGNVEYVYSSVPSQDLIVNSSLWQLHISLLSSYGNVVLDQDNDF